MVESFIVYNHHIIGQTKYITYKSMYLYQPLSKLFIEQLIIQLYLGIGKALN